MLDALDLALSWATWDTLRTNQECSVDRARKVIVETHDRAACHRAKGQASLKPIGFET